jgi:PAS domain-containing protein
VRDCLQRAITLIAAAACTAEKRDDDEILIAFSASHEGFHIEPGLCERWLATLCRVLQAGYRVVHIVRPGESTRQHVELIKELRQLLNPAWHYEPYYIPASDTTFMVPCDLVIVPHQGALQLFSTYHSQHVDSAFFFPHGSQHFDILRRYFTLIQANADPLLQTYAASSNAFAEAILAAEQHDGEEILLLNNVSFKRMPGYVHTERVRRILASYAELPDHKRALEVRLQRALKINERRRRRFEDRLREHPVYHICSKATIERMVKVGDYTDDWIAEFGPSAQLTAAEAAACVRQQIHDLQTFPQYELALVSEESAGEMTAHYWEVIGDHSALFAARLPRDDLAPVETSNTLYLATQVPAVVQALRNFCFQTWDELPAADKDKERVIAWLRALIS